MSTKSYPNTGLGATSKSRLVSLATSNAVQVWAMIGAAFIALEIYIFGSWLLTTAATVPTGPTPLPDWMKFAVRANEVVMGLGILWLFWLFVIKPKQRTGRLSLDGLIYLGFFFCWWQDPLFNYIAPGFTYNSYFFNLGGWAPHIPGWNSPNAGNMPEPLIWDLGFYLFISCGWIIFVAGMMRWIKARYPHWGTWRLLVAAFVATFIVDMIVEIFWVRTGMYVYPGAVDSWSLFSDRYYKFPIYESIGAGMVYSAWAAFRYFTNDKGQTFAERGIEHVRAPEAQKTFLRFLAITGALNVIFLIFYSFLIQIWQVHPGTYPKEVQERSYLNNGICGAGTDYACPGPNVPLPRGQNSLHIGPDGQLRVPVDTDIPTSPPLKTAE